MTKPTAPTIAFLKALGALEFKPLTEGDFMAFAGAPDDARIAYSEDPAICGPLGLAWGGAAIIIGAEQIEIHGQNDDGEPLSLQWNLEAGAC